MQLLIVLCITLLIIPISASAQDTENDLVDIAKVFCNQEIGLFTLKYIQNNDDFTSQPKLPKACQLDNTKYKISGHRGSFSETGACGSEPPVSITLTRNGKKIVSDTVFGGNCFGGPSVAGIEIKEKKGKIISIKLCIFKEHESPISSEDEFEPICIYLNEDKEIKGFLPITQSILGNLLANKNR